MKKLLFLMLLLAVGTIGCSSVSNKILNDEQGENAGYVFSPPISAEVVKIDNYTSMDIEYREGPTEVKITGPEKMVGCIRVRDYGSKIDFTLRPGVNSADFSRVKCVVTLPMINEVSLYGSGNFTATNINGTIFNANILGSGDLSISNISATSVKFLLRGSGDVKLGNIDCTNLQLLSQGSGDIMVNSIYCTTNQTILQGSGDARLQKVSGNQLELRTQGSGDILAPDIDVTSLKALVQGSGDISVGGNAGLANLIVQGSGDLSARKLKCTRVTTTEQGTGEIYTR